MAPVAIKYTDRKVPLKVTLAPKLLRVQLLADSLLLWVDPKCMQWRQVLWAQEVLWADQWHLVDKCKMV